MTLIPLQLHLPLLRRLSICGSSMLLLQPQCLRHPVAAEVLPVVELLGVHRVHVGRVGDGCAELWGLQQLQELQSVGVTAGSRTTWFSCNKGSKTA